MAKGKFKRHWLLEVRSVDKTWHRVSTLRSAAAAKKLKEQMQVYYPTDTYRITVRDSSVRK